MNEKYKEYLKDTWKEAETLCIKLGITDNNIVRHMHNKICQPYYYWRKEKKQNE